MLQYQIPYNIWTLSMNTTHSETEENIKFALNYYKDVFTAAKNSGSVLEAIQMRSPFGDNKQVMLAYDMIVPEPIEKNKKR